MSRWQLGEFTPLSTFTPPGRLELFIAPPAIQSRWKTLLRGFLVIPVAIVTWALILVLELMSILMWFAALFTGRVPESMWTFGVSILQFQARTTAYIYLLTDRYPPFALENAPYPVMLHLDGPPDRFNRAAVFFRIVLAVPAGALSGFLTIGLWPFLIAAWVVTVVTGKTPRSLHGAFAIVLRFVLRYYAWLFLLTTRYPTEPVGDAKVAAGGQGPAPLRIGRGIAVAAVVIGVVTWLSYAVIYVSVFSNRVEVISRINGLENRARTAAVDLQNRLSDCGKDLSCTESALTILTTSLQTQITTLQGTDFATDASRRDAEAVERDLQGELATVRNLQQAPSQAAYAARTKPLELEQTKFLADYNRLIAAINAGT